VIPVNMEVGELIDTLYRKRAERLEAQSKVEAMEAEEKAIREQVIMMLQEQGLEGGKGGVATAGITRRVVGQATNWDEIYQYVKENDAFDLLHRRISDTAYRDRLEQGEVVPGINPVEVVGLSLNKSTRKAE